MGVGDACLSIFGPPLSVVALAIGIYYSPPDAAALGLLPQVAPRGGAPAGGSQGPLPWQAVEPLYEIKGPFHNQVVNLREVGLSQQLGGAFSFMVTFEMDDLLFWARLFEFAVGLDQDSISAGTVRHTYDLHFTITQNDVSDARDVQIPDFFLMGRPQTVLFTVSDRGHMKIWQDGALLGENPHGHVPKLVDRPHLMVGNHHNYTAQRFRGRLYDIKVWNQEVSWTNDFVEDEDTTKVEEIDEPKPYYDVEPLLEVAGPFNEDSPGDLGSSGLTTPFGGAFSLMVTAMLDEVNPWSRVFDFCVAPDLEHIGAGMVDEGRGIHFTINQADNKTTVFVDDFFRIGQEITALFTVSSKGHMKLYVDGVLVGENETGQAPHYLKRPYMNIANHHLHEGQGFRGYLKDLKLWSEEVSWPEDIAWPEDDPEPAEDKEVAPWQEVVPLFQVEGPFNGSNPGNLAKEGLVQWLSGAVSIMMTIRIDEITKWARFFDFSSGTDFQAISAGIYEDTTSAYFTIMQGDEPKAVPLPDFIKVGHEFTALFSVSTEGHMKVYVDGKLLEENENGYVPEHVKRPHLVVGSHFKFKEQGVEGSIKDVRIWNQEVSWPSVSEGAAEEPEDDWRGQLG